VKKWFFEENKGKKQVWYNQVIIYLFELSIHECLITSWTIALGLSHQAVTLGYHVRGNWQSYSLEWNILIFNELCSLNCNKHLIISNLVTSNYI
jgi:hypothetical protein